MSGGGGNEASLPVFTSVEETFFDLVDCLCNRFPALSPFEILNRPTREVYDLYADCIIHDRREKGGGKARDEWVTSANATWH